jgi:hypothetical protein
MKTQAPLAARQRFVRAENAHRDDRRESFRDDEPEAGQGRLQLPIRTPLSFGKNERSIAGAQDPDQSLERTAVGAFLIDRNNIEFREDRTEERHLEQRFAREKINWAARGNSTQGRIEIALVIIRIHVPNGSRQNRC